MGTLRLEELPAVFTHWLTVRGLYERFAEHNIHYYRVPAINIFVHNFPQYYNDQNTGIYDLNKEWQQLCKELGDPYLPYRLRSDRYE